MLAIFDVRWLGDGTGDFECGWLGFLDNDIAHGFLSWIDHADDIAKGLVGADFNGSMLLDDERALGSLRIDTLTDCEGLA